MRLVATEYISLDGVFEEPGRWSGPWFIEDAGQFKFTELMASDALLLGRRTYEGFAAAWPTMKDTGEFGEKINSMPKYVVSSTLNDVAWSGSKLIREDFAAEVRNLKDEPGHDLLLAGSGQLLRGLMEENLIDLYRFMLYPVVLGSGIRLFGAETVHRSLELSSHQSLSSGIQILEYVPGGAK